MKLEVQRTVVWDVTRCVGRTNSGDMVDSLNSFPLNQEIRVRVNPNPKPHS